MSNNKGPKVHRHHPCWRCGDFHSADDLKAILDDKGRERRYCAKCEKWLKEREQRRAREKAVQP